MLCRAINNYQKINYQNIKGEIEILDVMSTDALECMEVFLVAYTCFNLNLENFAETQSNRQQR
jgi:hypothetical protein